MLQETTDRSLLISGLKDKKYRLIACVIILQAQED